MNSLVNTTGPWSTIKYSYDGAGNIANTTIGGTTTTYSYSSYNRLIKTQNSTTVNYAYDSNGNMISESYGSTTINYNFDYENRLVSAVKNGATLENNTYDGNGRLTASQSGSTSTFFMYDSGTNIIYESNNKTGFTQDNFYADGLLVGQLTSSNYYFLQQDALGSTRLVTTSTRSTSFSSDYIPYGENYGESGSQSFMYTGRLYNSSTGLYYLNARWYDPTIQRFMSEDLEQYASISSPLSLNRYIYAQDNPMRYTDPSGHMVGYYDSGYGSAYAVEQAIIKEEKTAASPEYKKWLKEYEEELQQEVLQAQQMLLLAQMESSSSSSTQCYGSTVPPGEVCGSPSEGGAILVAIGFYALGVGGLAAAVTVFPPAGIAAVFGFGAGIGATVYIIQNGPNSNARGAANAGVQAWPEALRWFIEHMQDLPLPLP